MKHFFPLLLVSIIGTLDAVPRFSLMNGASCELCHVNPTGGGLRNDYGLTVFGLDELPMTIMDELSEEVWDGYVSDYIQTGGDFRIQSMVYKNETNELKSPLFPMQSDIYLNFTPSENLSFFGRLDLSGKLPGEVWVLKNDLPGDAWLKAGKSLPDFGWKSDDHTLYTRGGNLRNTQGLDSDGLFLSPYVMPAMIEAGRKIANGVRATFSIANAFVFGTEPGYGSESPADKAYTMKISVIRSYFEQIHTTGMVSYLREKDIRAVSLAGGVAFPLFNWTFDIVSVSNRLSGNRDELALFHRLTFIPKQGIHIFSRYEFYDPDRNEKSGALHRIVFGGEFYVSSNVQLILQQRWKMTESDDSGFQVSEFILQFHYWF